MTRNLKLLTVFGIIWSIGFFSVLNWSLGEASERGIVIAVAAVVYGIGYALAGFLLGKRDQSHKTRLNLPLWYAMAGNGTSLLVGGIWVALFRPDKMEALYLLICAVTTIAIFWAISDRTSIKGIHKNELFK